MVLGKRLRRTRIDSTGVLCGLVNSPVASRGLSRTSTAAVALMQRIEKTVFISYRRSNAPWALAVYKELQHTGYDVFFDYTGISSGDFESVILENIRARAHFLILMTPSTLERCDDPGDWIRREIETALELRRNIVPLMLEGFDFSAPSVAQKLTGRLALLNRYNALRVPIEYFDEAMTRLREKHLNVALEAVLHPLSAAAKYGAQQQQSAVGDAHAIPIAVQKRRFGIHVAIVPDRSLYASSWFILAARADLSSDELSRQFPSQLKIGPVERIAAMVNLALPGIRLEAIGVPGVLSGQPDTAYFALTQTDDLWRELTTSGGIAMHVAGDFPGLVLELWAIRRRLGV
jgi:hypothetical protein